MSSLASPPAPTPGDCLAAACICSNLLVLLFLQTSLNAFMALEPPAWREARSTLQRLLGAGEGALRDSPALRSAALVPMADATMHLPAAIGDYTDFYASREHATNVGVMFRGQANALQPNWCGVRAREGYPCRMPVRCPLQPSPLLSSRCLPSVVTMILGRPGHAAGCTSLWATTAEPPPSWFPGPTCTGPGGRCSRLRSQVHQPRRRRPRPSSPALHWTMSWRW